VVSAVDGVHAREDPHDEVHAYWDGTEVQAKLLLDNRRLEARVDIS